MSSLIEPAPPSSESEPDSNTRAIIAGVAVVAVVVGLIVILTRAAPRNAAGSHPYAPNLKLTDLKMSTAENFVGASVTYIDGTVTNDGDKTVSHAIVHVNFKNSLDQVAQAEDVAVKILQTSGPYPDTIDLSASPLAPEQSKPFRLTFEHVSADWNHAYPELLVTDVSLK